MLVGYARVSTAEQSLALQQDALASAGCERVYSDVASGALDERGGLGRAPDYVRAGDTLVVWRLDRLGRSLTQLIGRVTKPRIMSPTQVEAARKLLADPSRPIADVCTAMRVSKATLYRYVPASTRPTAPSCPARPALQPAGGP